jgi:hypothetical protein
MGQPAPSGDHLSEACRLSKACRHCNIPKIYSETQSWASGSQPKGLNTGCTKKEEIAYMPFQIQGWKAWVSNGCSAGNPWEDRLSDIVDYRKVYGHCNVSRSYSEIPSWLIGL